MNENERKNSLSSEEKKTKILELKKLIQDEPSLNKFPYEDEAYLNRFLGGTCFNVEEAFDRIKSYYELLLEVPEWFTRDPPLAQKDLIEKVVWVALSETDKDGRPIYIIKIGNIDPNKMNLMDLIAVDDIWLESILLNFNSEKGLCVLMDVANIPWRSFKWLTPNNITTGLRKLKCLPFKDYRFHVVNDSLMVQAALKIVWPFLPQDLKDMVIFHFNKLESLHNFIDPEILPDEYGGTNGRINYNKIYDQLYAQNQQILESFRMCRSFETLE